MHSPRLLSGILSQNQPTQPINRSKHHVQWQKLENKVLEPCNFDGDNVLNMYLMI